MLVEGFNIIIERGKNSGTDCKLLTNSCVCLEIWMDASLSFHREFVIIFGSYYCKKYQTICHLFIYFAKTRESFNFILFIYHRYFLYHKDQILLELDLHHRVIPN